MAKKTYSDLTDSLTNKSVNPVLQDITDSVPLLTPGKNNHLPTSDPGVAGSLFVTGSGGMNLGSITGSGFAVFCVSQG